jgi:hypothetical protein
MASGIDGWIMMMDKGRRRVGTGLDGVDFGQPKGLIRRGSLDWGIFKAEVVRYHHVSWANGVFGSENRLFWLNIMPVVNI